MKKVFSICQIQVINYFATLTYLIYNPVLSLFTIILLSKRGLNALFIGTSFGGKEVEGAITLRSSSFET